MKRWKRILLVVLGVLVAIAIGGYTYLFHMGGIESIVTDRINDALGAESNLTVDIGRLGGNVFNELTLEGLSIDYSDSVRAFQVVTARRIAATYPFSALWDRTFEFERISIEGLDASATRTEEGGWLLPVPGVGGGGEGEAGGSGASFSIDNLTIDSARIRVDREEDTLWITNLNLAASLAVDGGTLSTELKRFGFDCTDAALAFDDLAGKVTFSDGTLLFQDLFVTRNAIKIKLSGACDVSEMSGSADIAIDNLDLSRVNALAGSRLRGMLDVNGSVVFDRQAVTGQVIVGGSFLFAALENLFLDFTIADKELSVDTLYGTILGNCGIDGAARVDFATHPETYQLAAEIRNFDLTQVVPGSFKSDLSGHLELDGESFSNAELLLKLDVNLYESAFDEYPLQRAVGSINITTDSLWFPDWIEIDYFENRFRTIGLIEYSDEIDLDIEADLINLDRYRGKLFIDQPGGRGVSHARLSGKTGDPDLSGWFASDSLWIYGLYADSCFSTFDIDRFLVGREGTVEVDLTAGAAWDVSYDTGYAHVTLDSEMVFIDTLAFRNAYAGLASRWQLDQGPYPWRLTIDSLSLTILENDFYNKSQMLIEVDSLGFNFQNTTIGEDMQSIVAHHRINFDETMDFSLEASDIPIAPWLRLFNQELDLVAVIDSGRVDLEGTMASPMFMLGGALDSIIFRDIYLGDLATSIDYRDRQVTIDSLVITSDSGIYHAVGQFYADLAFGSIVDERLPDRPFDLRITASDKEFDLVPLFLPSVEQLHGDFEADFRLHGTPAHPHLDGQATLLDGRLKYFDLVGVIQTDSAAIAMVDNKILLDTIRAYVVDKKDVRSYVNIDGELTVQALDSLHYDVNVDIPEELPFKYDLDDIEGIVMGNLHVLGDTPPKVTGDLSLTEGKYRVEFSDDETGSPLMIALSGENTWDLNINIEIPSNYWIKNEDIDAEFAGFLNIIREDGQYRFIGELEIMRGRGFLFDKTFRIIPDSARVIFEDIEHFNPRLDIWATSRIPLARADDEERSYQDLKVHVVGTLDNPEFYFFLPEEGGDEPLSYEAIVPLIVANYYGDESGGGAFEERISQLISAQVSQIGTRRLGVETFEIDPTYDGDLDLAQTRVTLGFYTGQSLYLWGRSDVGFENRPEAGFEYRFNKALLLEGFSDDDEDEGESYHLNFKLHWEF
jgi:hypothetical protein